MDWSPSTEVPLIQNIGDDGCTRRSPAAISTFGVRTLCHPRAAKRQRCGSSTSSGSRVITPLTAIQRAPNLRAASCEPRDRSDFRWSCEQRAASSEWRAASCERRAASGDLRAATVPHANDAPPGRVARKVKFALSRISFSSTRILLALWVCFGRTLCVLVKL